MWKYIYIASNALPIYMAGITEGVAIYSYEHATADDGVLFDGRSREGEVMVHGGLGCDRPSFLYLYIYSYI